MTNNIIYMIPGLSSVLLGMRCLYAGLISCGDERCLPEGITCSATAGATLVPYVPEQPHDHLPNFWIRAVFLASAVRRPLVTIRSFFPQLDLALVFFPMSWFKTRRYVPYIHSFAGSLYVPMITIRLSQSYPINTVSLFFIRSPPRFGTHPVTIITARKPASAHEIPWTDPSKVRTHNNLWSPQGQQGPAPMRLLRAPWSSFRPTI